MKLTKDIRVARKFLMSRHRRMLKGQNPERIEREVLKRDAKYPDRVIWGQYESIKRCEDRVRNELAYVKYD